MRKIVLSVITSCALLAFVPASALAHGHHRRHHRAHHARVHHKRFGHDWSQSGTGTGTSSDQQAGTVKSFTNGVLTITLNDGSVVSGKVTPDTEIECKAPETSAMQSHDRGDDNGGGDNSGSDNGGGDNSGSDNSGAENGGRDDNDQNESENENEAASCDTSALTAGTIVHEASLNISSAGAVWDKVELVSASAAGNNHDDD